MHHLLKNTMLSKHRVDASSWVFSQVLECSTPIHPLMPAMLVELANWYESISSGRCYEKTELIIIAQHARLVAELPYDALERV
jgi:hypothetical protein